MDKNLQNYLILYKNFLQKNNIDMAIEMLKKIVDYSAPEVKEEWLYELAVLYGDQNRFEESLAIYKRLLEMNPKNPYANYGMAVDTDLSGGDLNTSLKHYELAFKYKPDFQKAYYYAAVLADDLGDRKKSFKYYKKALKIDPYDYIALNDMGSLYERENQNDLALEYIERALELAPDFALALFNRGVVLKKLGLYSLALKSYYKAMEYSDDYKIYLNTGALYKEIGQIEKTKDILEIGVKKCPTNHILWYNLACAYSNLKMNNEAIWALIKAINIDERAKEWAKRDEDLKDLDFTEAINDYDKNR
ncbi:MAG: tetratricopeptide repeat protein [Tissierellia bacterium]|nr:tetratricopeptide repeat protein [Tissierellia bacterium]